MKYRTKFTITNMFTLNPVTAKHLAIGPPPPVLHNSSNSAAPTSTPVLTNPPETSRSANEGDIKVDIIEEIRSLEEDNSRDVPMCVAKNDTHTNPFTAFLKKLVKEKFISVQPTSPLPPAKESEGSLHKSGSSSHGLDRPDQDGSKKIPKIGTDREIAQSNARPASPFLKDRFNMQAYENEQNKFLADILNPTPKKPVRTDSTTKFSLGKLTKLFKGNKEREPPLNPLKGPSSKEACYKSHNSGCEEDVYSSGTFLKDSSGSPFATSVGAEGEKALQQACSRINYDSSTPTVHLKSLPQDVPLSRIPSGFESYEALERLKNATSDCSSRKCTVETEAEGIPNAIKEEVQSTEILQELRKYKKALSDQLQAQQKLIHMCSDQNLPSDQLASQTQPQSSHETFPIPDQLRQLMEELPSEPEQENGTDGDIETSDEREAEVPVLEDKPWEAELAMQVFDMSLIEPHFLKSARESQQQNYALNDGANGPVQNSTSYEEKKTLSSSPQLVPSLKHLENSYDKFTLGRESGQLLEGLKNFSPNDGFKILDSRPNVILDMLRKPVAVSTQRTPHQFQFSPVETNNPGSSQAPPRPYQQDENEERPSPFFPGLSGRMNMKIRNPQEFQKQGHAAPKKNVGGALAGELEELGNLLSRLPVISKEQLAEDYATKKSVPVSPMMETDVDSNISMIPLASSYGTLAATADRQNESRNQTTEDEGEASIRKVDTTKMSISELVTLGRKIYRILSQLNTTAGSSKTDMQPNVRKNSVSNVLNNNNGNNMKRQSFVNPMSLGANAIPTQAFPTGPGRVRTRSTHKVAPLTQSRSSLGKLLEPPSARLDKRSEPLVPRATHPPAFVQRPRQRSASNPSTTGVRMNNIESSEVKSESEKNIGIPSPRSSPLTNRYNNNVDNEASEQPESRRRPLATPYIYRSVREYVESSSSAPKTKTAKRNFINENIKKARLIKKVSEATCFKRLPPVPNKYENIQSVIAAKSRSRDKEMLESTSKMKMDREKRRAISLPLTIRSRRRSPVRFTTRVSPPSFRAEQPRQTESAKSNRSGTANSVSSPARSRSNSRSPMSRQSNRSRSPMARQRNRSRSPMSPESQPVPRYGHRSSASRHNPRSSVSPQGQKSPPSYQGPRPPVSHQAPSARSKDATAAQQLKMVSRLLSRSSNVSNGTRLLNPRLPTHSVNKIAAAARPNQSVMNRIAAAAATTKSTHSPDSVTTKAKRLSMGNGNKVASRKSRSKTKRDSVIAKELRNHSMSGTESLDGNNNNDGEAGVSGSVFMVATGFMEKQTGEGLSSQANFRKGKQVQGSARYFEGDTDGAKTSSSNHVIFTTPSEQELIREMVKAEMNQMVEKHVQNVLKQNPGSSPVKTSVQLAPLVQARNTYDQKKGQKPKNPKESKTTSKNIHNSASDDSDFGHLTKVYTPPRMNDESLFAIEKWINPEGSPYTSAKDTPYMTDADNSDDEDDYEKQAKKTTVRFSIPPNPSRKFSK